jgi:hypothetical protein
VLLLFASITTLQAQTVEEVKQKGSPYYWGEGVGKTASQAEEIALTMLINSISVNVEIKIIMIHEVENDTLKETEKTIRTTHSNATLKNIEILTWGKEPEVHVFRFVKKDEVSKIFAERKTKIKEFTDMAQRYEAKTQIADALQYYYWALMLMKSHPDANAMTVETDSGQQKLSVFLPARINAIFDRLKFSVTGKQRDGNITYYMLDVKYNDKLVANCDYSFFDGQNWSEVISAKDGKGISEMLGDTTLHKNLWIKIEYAFENEWRIDNEVYDVLHKVDSVIFPKCLVYVPVDIHIIPSPAPVTAANGNATVAEPTVNNPVNTTAVITQDVKNRISTMLERVENAIRSKSYNAVRDCFTDEGFDVFTRLIRYGNGVLLAKPAYEFIPFEDGILARSMSMRFTFSNNRRAFVEDVVFDISKSDGKIRSLSFALSGNVCGDIMKYKSWSEYSRIAIINFIETYKTAYALKRLDYIESIFSNNALIIVGRMVKQIDRDNKRYEEYAELTTFTKAGYIQHIGTVFRSNEYVNLKFTDINVEKAGEGDERYGIQLKQEYFSTNYGDTGYLFLLVDLEKPEKPVIQVRTWQPKKDHKFGVYDIAHF